VADQGIWRQAHSENDDGIYAGGDTIRSYERTGQR
jgi:hypothetical protein